LPFLVNFLSGAVRHAIRVRKGVAADDMAAPVQLPDLRPIEEPGSPNSTGRDQEVRFPFEFIQYVSDILLSANSTIVKSKKYRGAG